MTIWDELAEHAELPFERARMLPIAAYTDPDVLDRELDAMFGRDWLCVGRATDLPSSGDYLTAEIPVAGGADASRSIIVLRDDRGEIRAFDNVCVHRGARLLDGCGTTARMTCPYHAWVYRLDGSLIGGPYLQETAEADGRPFDAAAHRLGPIRVEEWEGLVFVNLDPDATPLAPRLAGLAEVVDRFDIASYVTVRDEVEFWPTNWKLLVENFMDAYHVFQVHRATFAADGDNTADTVMYPGTLDWAHHRVLELSGPELAAADRIDLEGDWRKTIVLAAVFPGLVMQLQPDWLWFLRITPLGTDRVRIAWQLAVAPETLAEAEDPDEYVRDLSDLIDRVNAEDLPIVTGIRRSLDRPQFERAPFSHLERNVYDVDRYIATRLSG